MLTVFLMVLPAALKPLGTGRAPVGAGLRGGPVCTEAEGARNPLLGVVGVFVGVAIFPVLFRVLGKGTAGNEELGGPIEGRGLGSVFDMAAEDIKSEDGQYRGKRPVTVNNGNADPTFYHARLRSLVIPWPGQRRIDPVVMLAVWPII
jgi:hypothetical protein